MGLELTLYKVTIVYRSGNTIIVDGFGLKSALAFIDDAFSGNLMRDQIVDKAQIEVC